MVNCPQCNNSNPPGAAFCDNCGASLTGVARAQVVAPVTGTACPSCGEQVIPGEAFCGNCGAALSSVQPEAPAVTPAPQPVVTPTPAPVPEASADAAVTCPACGTESMPGQAFCDNCGASLTAPPPVQPPVPQPEPQPAPPVSGRPRLVASGTGAEFDLTGKAEILVGREDPVSGIFPDVDLTPHGGEEGGVSRRHAKLTAQGAQWLVEDLNSVNFTFVNSQKLNPGAPQPLNDGDQIRMGRVLLTFHTT